MISAESIAIPGSTRFRRHEHETLHICVVIDGGFVERDGRTWCDVEPGTLRVSGAARHDIDFSTRGATCLVLQSDRESMSLARPRFIRNDSHLFGISRRIARVTQPGDVADRILAEDLTTELLAQISRRLYGRIASPPTWLESIRDLIHDTSGNASLTTLAAQAGVHRVHVARAFKDHYGVPVTTYSRRLRVRKALDLMSSESLSLSQLALAAGFSDQSHMTREIRCMTGRTPAAIRSMLHAFKT